MSEPEEGQPIMDALSVMVDDWRRAYRESSSLEVVLPWWLIVKEGGWDAFCVKFTDSARRLGGGLTGFSTTDPGGKIRRFEVPPREETP